MQQNMSVHDKENRHPNRRIIEEDISKIGKQYVVEGQRVKAKSIIYREDFYQRPQCQKKPQMKEKLTKNDFLKLQYLEKMGYLNEEEKKILQNMRRMGLAPKSQMKIQQNMVPQRSPPMNQAQNYYEPMETGYNYPNYPKDATMNRSTMNTQPYQAYAPYYQNGYEQQEQGPNCQNEEEEAPYYY